MSYQSPYHNPPPAEPRQREWVSRAAMLLFGPMVGAAPVPVGLMEKVLSPMNRPPLTGDRSPGSDDAFGDVTRRHRTRWWR